MKNRTSQILYAYWNDVRGIRAAPRRFDIEPARIAGILAETLILERIDEETYRFRLAGTRISERFAAELRGHNFLDLWTPEDRPQITELMQKLTDQAAAGVVHFELTSSTGRTAGFEAILLPLVHTRDVVDRFLGAMSASDRTDWIDPSVPFTIRLIETQILWPDGRPHAVIAQSQEPPPFHPHLALGTIVRQDRRQFRVFEGGRGADRSDKT